RHGRRRRAGAAAAARAWPFDLAQSPATCPTCTGADGAARNDDNGAAANNCAADDPDLQLARGDESDAEAGHDRDHGHPDLHRDHGYDGHDADRDDRYDDDYDALDGDGFEHTLRDVEVRVHVLHVVVLLELVDQAQDFLRGGFVDH